MMNRRAWAVIAAYALLALIFVPVYPHFPSPNEFSRWVLAAALAEDRAVEVTRFAAILGPRFEDLAEREGRFYSNKAPGLALISLPGYAAARLFTGPPSAQNLRPVVTAMRIVGATLPLLLLAILFLRLGAAYVINRGRIAFVVWLLLFATPLFTYGLLLFSHALVAATLFAAWAMLFGPRVSMGRDITAGVLIGLAVLSEYPAAIPASVLVLALLLMRAWRRVALVIAGGAPLAATMALYHYAAFGSPVRFPTQFDRLPEYRTLAHTAFLGIGVPSPANLGRLLFDPGKGLFVFAPVLIIALIALASVRHRLPRASWITLIAVPAALLLVHTGYPNWHGGWTTGPRYILPVVPFLLFALLFRAPSLIESVAAGWSAAAVIVTTIVFPFVPNAFPLPWGTLALPLLGEGLLAPNLLHLVARPLAIVVPLILIAGAVVAASDRKTLILALAGVLVAMATGVIALRSGDPVLRLQRAYIAEVYFEQPGAIERALPGVLSQQPRLAQRRASELALPPVSWPF
ncbi:MAG: hypothetical protein JJE51_09210 [Thermoanaerobaculia bacterium]|nr:hypothetical protein [Thermoanaerobaculia bacterium]